VIEDRERFYCDGCYAAEEVEEDDRELVHAEELADSEDYVDLELMDLMDSEDDDGLF
jgi:hypothetical protein